MRKILLAGILLISYQGICEAQNEPGKYGVAIPPTLEASEVTVKKLLSNGAMLLVTPSIYYRSELTDTLHDETASNTFHYIADNKYAEFGVYVGYRSYMRNSAIRGFTQPEIGLLASYRYSDYQCCSSSSNNSERDRKAISLGAGLKYSIGAEYYFSDSLSIEGLVGVKLEYIDYDLKKRNNGKFVTAKLTSGIRASWYWE